MTCIKKDKKKTLKKYLIMFTLVLLIIDIIAIKLCWDDKNSLGAVSFLLSGLFHISLVKESGLREKSFLFANIFGFLFFVGALIFSFYVHSLVPSYVNKWEGENIILTIEREKATIEFKDTEKKESTTYSSIKEGNRTIIKFLEYEFIYTEDNNKKKMCYSKENICLEELELAK